MKPIFKYTQLVHTVHCMVMTTKMEYLYIHLLNCVLLIHFSAMTDKWRMQELLNEDYIDPWGLDKDGKLDVRLTSHLWSQLQEKFPECGVVIDDVEAFMRDMEDDMLRKRESKEELKWFEDYVSKMFAA